MYTSVRINFIVIRLYVYFCTYKNILLYVYIYHVYTYGWKLIFKVKYIIIKYISKYVKKGCTGVLMKKKLTLSVDEKVVKTAKKKALDCDCSVSELFEYFIKATQKDKKLLENVISVNNSKKSIKED